MSGAPCDACALEMCGAREFAKLKELPVTDYRTSPENSGAEAPPRVAVPHRKGKAEAETRFFLLSDLEDAIAQLPQVRAVRMVATDDAIQEIHVISTPAISPKSLVRNIETLLLVRFGIHIDHRCLSIVQSLQSPVLTMSRPLIQAMRRVPLSEGGERLEIDLRASAQVAQGVCVIDAAAGELKAAGLALIDAINQMTGQRRLDLSEATLLTVQGHQLALVMIRWRGEQSDEWFVGTALADGDPLMAVARATLDAVNRKLVRLPLQMPQ